MHCYQYAKKNDFSTQSTSVLLAILTRVHDFACRTSFENVMESAKFSRELILSHSARRPPFSIGLDLRTYLISEISQVSKSKEKRSSHRTKPGRPISLWLTIIFATSNSTSTFLHLELSWISLFNIRMNRPRKLSKTTVNLSPLFRILGVLGCWPWV